MEDCILLSTQQFQDLYRLIDTEQISIIGDGENEDWNSIRRELHNIEKENKLVEELCSDL